MGVFQSEDHGKLLLRHVQRERKKGETHLGVPQLRANLVGLSLKIAPSVGCHNRINSTTSIQQHFVHPTRVGRITQDGIVLWLSIARLRDVGL